MRDDDAVRPRAAVADRGGPREEAGGAAQRTTARRRVVPRDVLAPDGLAVLAFEADRLVAALPIGPHTLLVGRAPECQLRLCDPLVSRRHCAIVPTPGLVLLRDLDSANGCFIGGWRVRWEPVCEGSIVELGNSLLRFVRQGSPEWRLLAPRVGGERAMDADCDASPASRAD